MKKQQKIIKLIITILVYNALISAAMIYLSVVSPVKEIVFNVEANAMIQQSTVRFNYSALVNAGLSIFAIAYLLEDCKYQPVDFGENTNYLLGLATSKINSFFGELVQFVFSKKVRNKIVLIAGNILPVNVSSIFDKGLSDDELLELTKRSLFIVCRSRGGKTTFLKYYLYTLIKSSKNIKLSICDINYGKPNDDGVINNWMQISPTFIHSQSSTVYAAIKAYGDELRLRKSECEKSVRAGLKANPIKDKPINLLVIEELISTRADLKKSDLWESALDEITDGLVCGLGYNCPIVVVSQSLAVNQTDIHLSVRDQFNIIALGKSTSSSEVIKDCGFDDVDETKSKVTVLKKQGKRPILIAGVDESKLATLPDLRWIDEVQIQIKEPVDINQQWWEDVYANNEANQKWLIERVLSQLAKTENSITSSSRVSELQERFGIKPDRQDKRYVDYFRPELDRLIEELKNV
jgi:hypothetical protein